jgi:hypothetical protein
MRLADRESVQDKLGAAALAIQQGRLLTMQAAWALDQGSRARAEISMAKVVVSEALHQAADAAIQVCGARGYSRDTVLEWIYRYARLVDGASEVHRMVLRRRWRKMARISGAGACDESRTCELARPELGRVACCDHPPHAAHRWCNSGKLAACA